MSLPSLIDPSLGIDANVRNWGDSVEKVAFPAKRRVLIEMAEQSRLTSCHRHLPGDADLGELAQVLGGCGEVEFVSGAIGSA